MSQQLGALRTHATNTFLFISHTMNIPLFEFCCDIFIGVRIIKEIPGLVASGTHCICCICQVCDKKWEYNGAVLQLFMDVPTAYDAVGRVISYNILMEFCIPLLHLPVEKVQLSKEDFMVTLCINNIQHK